MSSAIIMGVAGSGKTSVGLALAPLVGVAYIDGDSLHTKSNIEKMSAGTPLTDLDREPWLIRVGDTLRAARTPTLVGCSALKRRYRDLIREHAGKPVVFVHLTGAREVIADRMLKREGHFMPTSLIDSQFADLEPLQGDEAGFEVDIDQSLDAVAREAAKGLAGSPAWDAA